MRKEHVIVLALIAVALIIAGLADSGFWFRDSISFSPSADMPEKGEFLNILAYSFKIKNVKGEECDELYIGIMSNSLRERWLGCKKLSFLPVEECADRELYKSLCATAGIETG